LRFAYFLERFSFSFILNFIYLCRLSVGVTTKVTVIIFKFFYGLIVDKVMEDAEATEAINKSGR